MALDCLQKHELLSVAVIIEEICGCLSGGLLIIIPPPLQAVKMERFLIACILWLIQLVHNCIWGKKENLHRCTASVSDGNIYIYVKK